MNNQIISPDDRIKKAIKESFDIYIQRLISEFNLEANFQHDYSMILEKNLQLNKLDKYEMFQVVLEKNIPIGEQNNYVDIVVKYDNLKTNVQKQFLIELKNKKEDSAEDIGVICSFGDISNLNHLVYSDRKADGAFFIFITSSQKYISPKNNTTQKELPMFDGAQLIKNSPYTVSKKSAQEAARRYNNHFYFHKDYNIEYTEFKIKNKSYWYFMLEI